jgi:centromeric protein E
MLIDSGGEIDVGRLDPEEALVDFQTVEPGDISGDVDETWLKGATIDHGREDKVMVSIR